MSADNTFIQAPFVAPVRGLCTTRLGGASAPPFDSLNLGAACGDRPASVERNRALVTSVLPAPACWLRQVHGADVIHLDEWSPGVSADAAWTDRPGQVSAILTADCLPILIAEPGGQCVAAIHAGWRGLAAGVIPACIAALPTRPEALVAWIGPRICRHHYEVDAAVRDAFDIATDAFTPTRPGHWLADLPEIARKQLHRTGLETVMDSALCTAGDNRFFSYRRDGRTGRMATLVWIEPDESRARSVAG